MVLQSPPTPFRRHSPAPCLCIGPLPQPPQLDGLHKAAELEGTFGLNTQIEKASEKEQSALELATEGKQLPSGGGTGQSWQWP